MCLRDNELNTAAERVCNRYSKLSNVARGEVVHTESPQSLRDDLSSVIGLRCICVAAELRSVMGLRCFFATTQAA